MPSSFPPPGPHPASSRSAHLTPAHLLHPARLPLLLSLPPLSQCECATAALPTGQCPQDLVPALEPLDDPCANATSSPVTCLPGPSPGSLAPRPTRPRSNCLSAC